METALEHILISSYKEGMIAFLKDHPEYFDEAIALAITDKQPYSWRAAWLLWSCIGKNDQRVVKHIKEIVQSIKSKNDGHQRELLKILLEMELRKEYEGRLFDLCMDIWEQTDKRPSVRFTSLKVIIKIAKKHPELAKEITFLTREEYLSTLSSGVKKSISKMLKNLKQLRQEGL